MLFSRRSLLAALSTLLAVAFALPAPGQAQVEKPFKIVGVGIAPEALPLPGTGPSPIQIDKGQATHMGRHVGFGDVQTYDAAIDPNTGTIKGTFGSDLPFTFIDASGDELECTYGGDSGSPNPGTFELFILDVTPEGYLIVEGAFIAEFVVQGGTGKLAGTTGSWTMYAYSDPFILGAPIETAFRWEGEGKLTFQKGGP
jgi:hypothetical protein